MDKDRLINGQLIAYSDGWVDERKDGRIGGQTNERTS